MRRAARPVALLAVATVAAGGLAACGSSDDDAGAKPRLVVGAAASLTGAVTECGPAFDGATVRSTFAGSDELATQIRQGVPIDVFAAANATLPEQLFEEGKVERPVTFAGNELVLAVPAKGGSITGLGSLESDSGAKIAVGSPSVPVGSYTRKVLAKLPAAAEKAITARIRTQEPDVKSVLAKLQQGVVDAAFVYRTDVQASKGAVKAITLPANLGPKASYEAAVVKGSKHQAQAKAFVDGLRSGGCQRTLRAAGFLPPTG